MNIRFRQIIKAECMMFDARGWSKTKNNIAKRCLWRVRLYTLEKERQERAAMRKNKSPVSDSDIIQKKIEAYWGNASLWR